MGDANWDNINRLLDEIESAKTMREHGAFLHNLCKQQQLVIASRDAEIERLRQQVAELQATVAAGETERKELHDLVIELQDNIAFNRTGRIP